MRKAPNTPTSKNDENITVNESVPRGRILDRNGKVLVDNASKLTITYTRSRKTSQKDMLDTAKIVISHYYEN